MISVLCVNKDSVYKSFPGLDVWDSERNVYNFIGSNPVITHAPCQQWSKLKFFAKENQFEKNLAWVCLEHVLDNGGIFEHPSGSEFFKKAGINKNIYSIDQHWFGFPCRKRTYLFFHKCKPLPVPMRFEAIEKKVEQLHSSKRSDTTPQFAKWLIDSVTSGSLHCF